MERPAPDPTKLLAQWMAWERGEETPGRVIANLKTGGLRLLLEELAGDPSAEEPMAIDTEAVAAWTPVV